MYSHYSMNGGVANYFNEPNPSLLKKWYAIVYHMWVNHQASHISRWAVLYRTSSTNLDVAVWWCLTPPKLKLHTYYPYIYFS